MLRIIATAALAALATAGDQFCFDHSGTPTGRAITDGKSGPDASTTRLTLPGQDDPPARVDDADAPVEVPLQGSSPEGRGGCAIA